MMSREHLSLCEYLRLGGNFQESTLILHCHRLSFHLGQTGIMVELLTSSNTNFGLDLKDNFCM